MKAIVFDMDGILFDTERVGDRAWRQAAAEMDFSSIDMALENCRGLNHADTKAYFAANFPEVDYSTFHMRNHEIMAELLSNGMPVKSGAYALLQWLREEGWKVALATSTGQENTMHHLNAAQMTELFNVIVTGEQVTHGKPDPEIYETACRELGAIPAHTFAVEDSPNGIRSAFAAKMRVIMVPDLVAPNLELRQMTVTVQSTLLDVRDFLEKYGEMQ